MEKRLLILFLFFQFAGWSQKADLSSPRATIYTHIENLKPNNYYPEISAQTIYGLDLESAIDKAIKLKYIYDAKGVFIDYSSIPSDPNYIDSLHFPVPKHAYKPFPYKLPQVYVEKYGKNWYYSKETVAQIDILYKEIYKFGADLIVKYVPGPLHMKFLGLELWQWLGLFIIIIITYLLHLLFKKILYLIFKSAKNLLIKIPVDNLNERLKHLAHPLSYIFGIYMMQIMLPYLLLGQKIGKLLIVSLQLAEVIFWIFVFIKLIDIFIAVYKFKAQKTKNLLDDQFIPIIENTLKTIVIIFGIFKILVILGADPRALIAGASIGGLAVGLAAQDTVKNLIGSIMIFIDKPFKIGDWIKVDGVEGSVEEVGFRSSIIRAADTTIYKIPNSKLSEAVVNNLARRIYRRYNTTLGIRYDTPPELIEEFIEGIKKVIELHPLTRNYSNYTPYNSAPYNVEFVEYGDSSLNILLNVYFVTKDYGEEMHARHILLLGILVLANNLGVEFAFPSQTLFMELFPEKKPAFPQYPQNKEEIKKRLEQAINTFQNKIIKY